MVREYTTQNLKRLIFTVIGLLILLAGMAAGVYLIQQQQEIREKAAPTSSNR